MLDRSIGMLISQKATTLCADRFGKSRFSAIQKSQKLVDQLANLGHGDRPTPRGSRQENYRVAGDVHLGLDNPAYTLSDTM